MTTPEYCHSVSQIVEGNGLPVYENNQKKTHSIAVGTLVEVKYDNFFGDGACEVVHARLWVVSHGRDCDGTPLYCLSSKNPNKRIIDGWRGGFREEDLTVTEAVPSDYRYIISAICLMSVYYLSYLPHALFMKIMLINFGINIHNLLNNF